MRLLTKTQAREYIKYKSTKQSGSQTKKKEVTKNTTKTSKPVGSKTYNVMKSKKVISKVTTSEDKMAEKKKSWEKSIIQTLLH